MFTKYNIPAFALFVALLIHVTLGSSSASSVSGEINTIRDRVGRLFRTNGEWDKKCGGNNSKIGIKFLSMDTRETVYSLNETGSFIPASNVKLITTVAALNALSPHYRFKTEVYHDGTIDKGRLHGNLYIKGYGDPDLVSEELWLIVRELYSKGLRKIAGDIIGDDRFFDNKRHGNGWEGALNSRAYSAELGALSLNFNTTKIYIDSFEEPGKRPDVLLDPPTNYLELQNRITSGGKNAIASLSVKRNFTKNRNVIVAEGVVPERDKRRTYYRNITNPPLYFVTVFTEFLEAEGINVTGKAKTGVMPEGLVKLTEHKSKPLSLIVRGLNKFSNNFVAEQILKTMGAEFFSPPGTTGKGLGILKRYLSGIGIQSESYTLVGASGFSRQNRFTPAQFVAVLTDAYKNFKIKAEVVSSLSVLGRDGSLKNRHISTKLDQQVRAKTGTLSGVSALSGFMGTRSGHTLAFSILMNAFDCRIQDTWEIQNRVLSAIFEL